MASAGSFHPQVDVKYDEAREKIKAPQFQSTPTDEVLDESSRIYNEWPEPPPDDRINVVVSSPGPSGSGNRNNTPTGLTLGIGAIDEKINKELDSLRGLVKAFLENPEPRTSIPLGSDTHAEQPGISH